jgi:hypothetical protein
MSTRSKRTFGWLGLAIAGVIAGLTPRAHAQEWVRQFGSSRGDFASALAPDGEGGVMVAGYTWGSLGGPNAGLIDAYLAHYTNAGQRLWMHQFGTRELDMALALAPDGAGGVMVAGFTAASLGGPNAGLRDAYLARYDNAGQRLWIRQFGTTRFDQARALAPDGAGGVLVAGRTDGSLGGPNAGGRDVFLARYDSVGERLWILQFGTRGYDQVYALAPDGAGGVMVAGMTEGSLAGHAGRDDAYLARYDSAGNRLWIRQFGTSVDDSARALAPDGAGGAIVTGFTHGSLGGPSAGGSDAFVARYDGAGNQLWVRQIGTSGLDKGQGAAPDGAGGALIGGETGGSLGGPHAGGQDVFLARYDSAGNQLWISQIGTSLDDIVNSVLDVSPDGAGGVVLTAETHGNLGGPNAGGFDAYLARFSINACAGDLDNDGDTDLTDLGILLADFGCVPPGPCAGDLDNDGDTDLADLGILLADFGCGGP